MIEIVFFTFRTIVSKEPVSGVRSLAGLRHPFIHTISDMAKKIKTWIASSVLAAVGYA